MEEWLRESNLFHTEVGKTILLSLKSGNQLFSSLIDLHLQMNAISKTYGVFLFYKLQYNHSWYLASKYEQVKFGWIIWRLSNMHG